MLVEYGWADSPSNRQRLLEAILFYDGFGAEGILWKLQDIACRNTSKDNRNLMYDVIANPERYAIEIRERTHDTVDDDADDDRPSFSASGHHGDRRRSPVLTNMRLWRFQRRRAKLTGHHIHNREKRQDPSHRPVDDSTAICVTYSHEVYDNVRGSDEQAARGDSWSIVDRGRWQRCCRRHIRDYGRW